MMETWSDSLDFRSLAREYGTPLYVFSPARLLDALAAHAALVGAPSRVMYPLKANSSLPVLRTLVMAGAGADCASPSEVELASLAGFPGDRVFYNSSSLDPSTARAVLLAGGTVVANSSANLRMIADIMNGTDHPGQVFLRWNPSVATPPGQKFTAHGAATSQFGMAEDELLDAVRTKSVAIDGIHTHVGSRLTDLSVFIDAINRLHQLMDKANQAGGRIGHLNLGGGLASPVSRTDAVPGVADLRAALAPLLRSEVRYYVEPGNSLVGDCMGVLTTLVDVRREAHRAWAVADIGSDQLLKISIMGRPHDVLDVKHRPLANEGPDTVFGPLNFVGDVLLPNTSLAGLDAGEVLFIQHCGAYCQALGNHFNGRHAPAIVRVGSDGATELCATAEQPWLDVARSTYLWETDTSAYPQPLFLQPGTFTPDALWSAARRLSDNTFEFDLHLVGHATYAYTVCQEAVMAALACRDPLAPAARLSRLALAQHISDDCLATTRTVRVALGPPGSGTVMVWVRCSGWFDAHGEATIGGLR
jgi:diaminopimelate decarboxylase